MKQSFILRLKTLILCIAIFLSSGIFTGCSEEDFTLYFGVDALPSSLDPQRASLYSERLAIRNCFAGLTKIDENGNAILDVANNFTVSEDGLVYTFTLGDSEWNNGETVTSMDFVFALQRACDPTTKTKEVDKLINIEGAKQLLSGEEAELGVWADGDDTLNFRLVSPDSNFLYKLSSPVFMPCNEDFFNKSKGKYGLGVDYILTNGNFKLASWSTKGKFVRLNRTTKDDKSLSEVKSLYISMGTSGKDTITRINDGEIGMTLNHTNDYSSVNTSKYNIESNYNKNYIIVFNKETTVGGSDLLTEAFATSVDREYLISRLNSRHKNTLKILPENSIINCNLYEHIGNSDNHVFMFSPEEARKKFLKGLSDAGIKKFPNISALTVNNTEVKSALTDVITKWQSILGAYINIETVENEDKLMSAVNNKQYTVAFIPINNNIIETLNLFTSGSAIDIKSSEYDGLVENLSTTYDKDEQSILVDKTLEILSKQSSVIPIYSAPSVAVWNKEYKNVCFSKTDMTVDFSIIHK